MRQVNLNTSTLYRDIQYRKYRDNTYPVWSAPVGCKDKLVPVIPASKQCRKVTIGHFASKHRWASKPLSKLGSGPAHDQATHASTISRVCMWSVLLLCNFQHPINNKPSLDMTCTGGQGDFLMSHLSTWSLQFPCLKPFLSSSSASSSPLPLSQTLKQKGR